ncbi:MULTISPECIES: undecaprenyl-phosphate glucose phosphotransferase [unclassified Achromobacter]|uniref:undecaprenyl-phosphate glucose phosphotransferase n=1 Tax=unclassified Achromobacter TaxID=2626865 RepID=UPI000B51DB27|nr:MULTISPECIES: undecaprenyl-phosphate glucose phosphotransferase [unclassified Achromobacter]OWT68978.1 undecaprenyl-phosphate glucose phosphotransferase [Achromobacter sp. HZ28]OWT78459.1 undecaprenyl-phosphate glucose phosphotransferase [Achromobacter sp. HZ34]
MDASTFDVSGKLPGTSTLFRAADAALVAVTGLAAIEWQAARTGLDVSAIHSLLVYFGTLATLVVFPAFRLYGSWRGRPLYDLVIRSLAAWTGVFAMGLLVGFLTHQVAYVSRLWAAVWFVAGAVSVTGLRLIVYAVLSKARDRGLNHKRVLLIGFGTLGHDMWARVAATRTAGYEVMGIYTDGKEQLPPGVRRLDNLSAISAFVRQHEIREVWLAMPMEAGRAVREVMFFLRHDLIDIRWIPDVLSVRLLGSRVEEFLGVPAIELNSLPAAGIRGMSKAIFDRAFSALVLLGLSPLLLFIAAWIKLDSRGPVFFTQPRLGVDGEVFRVYKFRSMTVHAEQNGVVTQATRDDRRVTRIGAFLRKTSLDELPQFINVLRGEMSVVGPRPHALEHNEQYKDLVARYMMRHRVKPGITGWAQINGLRGQTETVRKMRDRVEFDLYYIQNWSFLMDLQIIARTAVSGWTGKNVY